MTGTTLARAILGPIMPLRDDMNIPTPYRATVALSRSAKKLEGSQPVEPGEVVTPPITEEPT